MTARNKDPENTRISLSFRGEAVRHYQRQGYEKWKEKHNYGKRWSVEGFFSAVKRCFGETDRVTSPQGMIREVKRKFAIYNLVRESEDRRN